MMAGQEADAVAEAIRTIRAAGRGELLTEAALEATARARPPEKGVRRG